MEIKDIQGNILIDALVTEQAVKVDELMKQHSITLSWVAVSNEQLPLGAYIDYEGVRYSLLEPYNPEQSDEATYNYKPEFQHPVMRWQHLPFFFYTYSDGSVVSKEPDWSLTDNPANFMSAICDAIKQEVGEDWTYEIADNLILSASLSFSNTDIFSALGNIAGAFETEWWFDYASKIIYLSKAQHGTEVTLEVGNNIGVPLTKQSSDGYATRFYVFGSTRNIEQNYTGSNTNSIINKRLTLNPEKYPNGYIDIKEGLTNNEILVKTLFFDDIYPRSSLTISDVKVRLMWRLDNDNQKVQIGTDANGNPVYDQYAIWYFKIPGLSFSKDMVISGKALSVHFNSGPLQGREFELTYHDEAKNVSTIDGNDIKVEKGDFEINFIEEGTYIIPAVTGLIPIEGNEVTLFNIVMPEEYKASAYTELENEAKSAILKQGDDTNNYSFNSNPVAFYESNPNLSVGRKVSYKNGGYTYSTRVIKLETQLDRPFEQKITIGSEQIKGNTQTLKEEVVSANQNIDLIAALNESTAALQQAMLRSQKMLQDELVKYKDLGFSLKTYESNGETKYYVESAYDFASKRGITSGGKPSGGSSSGSGSKVSVSPMLTQGEHIATITVDGIDNLIYAPKGVSKTSELTNDAGFITSDALNPYATKDEVGTISTNLSSLQSAHDTLRTDFDNLNNLLNDNTSGVIDTWNEVVNFLEGYKESEDLATILSGMNTEIGKRALQSDFLLLQEEVAVIDTSLTALAVKVDGIDDRVAVLEALGLSLITEDGKTYLQSAYNFYSLGGVSSGGKGTGSGGVGGGSNVSYKGELTTGMLLGTITIDGLDNKIYGPSALSQLSNDVGYITSSALGGYLPLSGGTIDSKNDQVPLGLSNTAATIRIAFTINNIRLGYLGFQEQNKPLYFDSYGSKYALIHSGNYSSYALPLSGGTMNGNINLSVATNQIVAGGVLSSSYEELAHKNSFGYISLGPFNAGYAHIYTDRDYFYFNKNILINGTSVLTSHQDISHLLSKTEAASTYLPLSGGTFNFPYLSPGATVSPRIGKFDRDAGSLVFQVGTSNIFDIVDSGWKITMLRVTPDEFHYYGNNIIHSGNIGSYAVKYAGGASVDTARHSIGYDNNSQGSQNLPTVGGFISADQGAYGFQLLGVPSGSNLFFRGIYNNSLSYWKTIAFTDSNVASATKLQDNTTFTAWGQTFFQNGVPKNVSGTLSNTDGKFYLRQYGIPDNVGNLGLGVMIGSAPENYGIALWGKGSGNGYIQVGRKDGRETAYSLILQPFAGNVGIGTDTPSFTLDVIGTLRATGRIYVNEWIHIEGQRGLYFPSTGFGQDCYIQPNNISSHGGFVVQGKKTNYHGILIGSTNAGINLMHTGAYGGLYRESVDKWLFFANDYNEVTIGDAKVSSTGYMLWVAGSTYVSGNFYATGGITSGKASDRRLKDNILNILQRDSVNVLRALRPVQFRWNSLAHSLDKRLEGDDIGFIADEFESIIPNSGRAIWDKYRAIEYDKCIPHLVNGWNLHDKALIAHNERIESVESRLAKAEVRIKELENELKQYKEVA